jgi:hypothetical protein
MQKSVAACKVCVAQLVNEVDDAATLSSDDCQKLEVVQSIWQMEHCTFHTSRVAYIVSGHLHKCVLERNIHLFLIVPACYRNAQKSRAGRLWRRHVTC